MVSLAALHLMHMAYRIGLQRPVQPYTSLKGTGAPHCFQCLAGEKTSLAHDRDLLEYHRDSKKLDRAGRGASGKFWYIDHQQLSEKINFELQNNNYVLAAGKVWQRTGCIPMGGSFSAEATDLHCQWGVYTFTGKFRDLGDPRISDAGFVYWVTPWGHLTLCQFQDNILMATSFPNYPSIRIVQRVCKILNQCWDL